jgi:hypothetical protein
MTNQSRGELLKAVAELCERYPHWRFGQLVANIAGWSDQDVWDVEDDQLLIAARSHLAHIRDPENLPRFSEATRAMK